MGKVYGEDARVAANLWSFLQGNPPNNPAKMTES